MGLRFFEVRRRQAARLKRTLDEIDPDCVQTEPGWLRIAADASDKRAAGASRKAPQHDGPVEGPSCWGDCVPFV